MAVINSREEFREWLKGKPADWAQVLAARAALRALPYAFGKRTDQKWVNRFALGLHRAISASWAARNFPAHDKARAASNADAANAAAHAAADAADAADASEASDAADAAAAAASAAYATADAAAYAAAYAAYAAAHAAYATAATYAAGAQWANVNHDCQWLEGHTEPAKAARRLTHRQLWPAGEPDGWGDARDFAMDRLESLKQGFGVWSEWYARRVRGERAAFDIPGDINRREDKAILARLADARDEDFWSKGATHVNTELQRWIDEARERVRAPDPVSGDEIAEPDRIDFFISYSTKEEAVAREVEAILTERGYSSIAQFKNFAQGNFVREMRVGIAMADRFIALQSKAYWESDHCQSEWDAAYARDPGARRRKIVPFLLEPVALPPIASETVYQPLYDLTGAARKKAIIEWVEYQPPPRTPPQLRRVLAEQASPDVRVKDERIDAGPNSLFDRPLVDMDLAELPGSLRALLSVLIASLPANTPSIVRNCLQGYQNHLLERGAQPIVGTIDPFAEAVRDQIRADSGLWDAGLETLFKKFFERHRLLITHYPLNPKRELVIAETPIDEEKATGDNLLEPVEAVANAMEALKSADLTTDDFDRVEAAHKAFSRDIASLPMPRTSDDVTPKRRYVLGTIGFYERLLAALGAVAGIASSPQGQAAIAAVASAIEKFMGFIR